VDARFLTRELVTRLSAPLFNGGGWKSTEIVSGILMQGAVKSALQHHVRVHPFVTSLLNVIKLLLRIGLSARTNLRRKFYP